VAQKEEEEEEEEDVPKEEPKAKNPLDSLPKSDFNLEDWKRAYSNLDTRGAGGSIEWFDGKFDKEGFSTWRVDFKYNEELTQVFMSSNQIGGFFNRLEASRKYLFASVGVLGTAKNSVISGVLILRGQDVKPVVDVAPDWESYSYSKLDLSKPGDKKFFEGALAWDLEVDGPPYSDRIPRVPPYSSSSQHVHFCVRGCHPVSRAFPDASTNTHTDSGSGLLPVRSPLLGSEDGGRVPIKWNGRAQHTDDRPSGL